MEANRFGLTLKALREQAGLTQGQLAEKAGLSLTGTAQIEQGRREPGWSTVLALASALGVSVEAFAEAPPADAAPRGRGRPRKSEPLPTAAPQRRTGRKMPGKSSRRPKAE